MSEYYAGILDFLKDYPEILLECFTYGEQDFAHLAACDGFISYGIPPPEMMARIRATKGRAPAVVAITMRDKAPDNVARAHINANKVADCVVDKLLQRHCRVFAFCSSHSPHLTDETSQLLHAYRRAVWNRTHTMPHLFRTTVTSDYNLIPDEMARFVDWFKTMPHPLGMFVHGDDVAKKMLDTCRLFGIDVPREMKVVGTGNSSLLCERTIPSLSSYAVDHEPAGYDAAQALYAMLENGVSARDASFEIGTPGVVERGSTLDEHGSARLADMARLFIHGEIDDGHAPSIAHVAHHFNVSRAKIQKDFRATFGHGLHEELANYRLDKLEKLLKASSDNVSVLAARVGFASISQANRAFLARHGKTMTAFRRQNG